MMFFATFMLVVFWMIVGGFTISHCLIHPREQPLAPPDVIPKNLTATAYKNFTHASTVAVVCFSESALLVKINNVVGGIYKDSIQSYIGRDYPPWGISFASLWPIMQIYFAVAIYRMYWSGFVSSKMPSSSALLLDMWDCIILFGALFDQAPYFWFESGALEPLVFLAAIGFFWSLTVLHLAYEFTAAVERFARDTGLEIDEEQDASRSGEVLLRQASSAFQPTDSVVFTKRLSSGLQRLELDEKAIDNLPTKGSVGVVTEIFNNDRVEIEVGEKRYRVSALDLQPEIKSSGWAKCRAMSLNLVFLTFRLILHAKTEYVTYSMMLKNVMVLLMQIEGYESWIQSKIKSILGASDASYREIKAEKDMVEIELKALKEEIAKGASADWWSDAKVEAMNTVIDVCSRDAEDVRKTVDKVTSKYNDWRRHFQETRENLRPNIKKENHKSFDDFCIKALEGVREFVEDDVEKIKADSKEAEHYLKVGAKLQSAKPPRKFKSGDKIFRNTELLEGLDLPKNIRERLMKM
jgi:hypothetical protein